MSYRGREENKSAYCLGLDLLLVLPRAWILCLAKHPISDPQIIFPGSTVEFEVLLGETRPFIRTSEKSVDLVSAGKVCILSDEAGKFLQTMSVETRHLTSTHVLFHNSSA
jgi:hypothetical protein